MRTHQKTFYFSIAPNVSQTETKQTLLSTTNDLYMLQTNFRETLVRSYDRTPTATQQAHSSLQKATNATLQKFIKTLKIKKNSHYLQMPFHSKIHINSKTIEIPTALYF